MMKSILFLSLFTLCSCLQPADRENRAHIVSSMAATLEKQFSGVPSFNKASLPSEYQFVDLREDNERLISTLPGSISKAQFEANLALYKSKVIVAFDTLGQRSLPWVSSKRAQGLKVFNLQGGILAWAHAGGKFVDVTGQPTKRVHVYAEAWEMLPDGFEAITQ